MNKKEHDDMNATIDNSHDAYQDKLFGKTTDYHIIEYKKFPYIIYQNFFHPVICKKIIDTAEEQLKYEPFNDRKSRYNIINFNKYFAPTAYKWIIKPLNAILLDANNKNFMLDVTQIEYINLLKFYEGDFLDWHHDCDWLYNPLPFDKKITMLIQLNSNDEFEGGEFEKFMSTIPIDNSKFDIGSVLVIPTYFYYKIKPITRGLRKLLNVTAIGPKYK